MRYYKLINGTSFVGIGTSFDMLYFQLKHRVFLRCDETEAQYIRFNDTLYRANWMIPETVDHDCIVLDVIEIDESEYNALFDAIESEKEIPDQVFEDTTEEEVYENPDVTIEYVREMKIVALSNACNKVIESGFDVTLSDGSSYHFSLTTQDQLNLLSLSAMIAAGATSIPYHADGELCKYYTADDMANITAMATAHKTYHTSYYNSLRNWVNALSTIEEISSIQYGMIVPEEYCSDVLIDLNAQVMANAE